MEFRHFTGGNISSFVGDHEAKIRSYPVVVISCLDSNPDVSYTVPFEGRPETHWGRCVFFTGAQFLLEVQANRLFPGFDEVWFGSALPTVEIPFPAIVGPCESEEYLPEGFAEWFSHTPLEIGLGDGVGLTIVSDGGATFDLKL